MGQQMYSVLVNPNNPKLGYEMVARKANSLLVMENKEDAPNTMAYPATEWDLAFDGYQLRTNSGTSGIGKGGAADLGYGEYDKWTSKAQVDAYLAEHNMTFAVDDSASVYVTMSQNDWNKYCKEAVILNQSLKEYFTFMPAVQSRAWLKVISCIKS